MEKITYYNFTLAINTISFKEVNILQSSLSSDLFFLPIL